MLANWTYSCSCGHRFDHFYEAPRPTTVACVKCGEQAGWSSVRSNAIHSTGPGRHYGEFDPQYGCVVRDYNHRQQLLKERGWEELPPEDPEEVRHGEQKGEGKDDYGRDPNVIVADDMDEIEKLIDQDMVDRKLTGERERRPMQDSAYSMDPND